VGHHRNRHGAASPPAKPVATVVFDEDAMKNFLRAVAQVTVLAKRASLEWDYTKDAKVTDYFIFWVSTLGEKTARPPGIATLGFGTEATIRNEQLAEARKLATEFVARVKRSPQSGLNFLEEQERARERALDSLAAFRAEIAALNREFGENTALLLAAVVVAKCSATIVWKSLGLVATTVKAFLADVGYDVAVNIATEWEEAKSAELAMSVGKEAGIDVVEEADKRLVEKSEDALADAVLQAHSENLASLSKNIERWVAGKATAAELPYSLRVLKRMKIASAFAKGVKKGVSVLWLAKDVFNAVSEAHRTLNELDYFDTVRRRW
jgi:hypothetical protein